MNLTENIKENKSKFSAKKNIVGCSILFFGLVILTLLASGIFVHSLIVTIKPDEVAIVLSPYEPNGISETPLNPGRHILRPTERLEIFKISHQKYSSTSTFRVKDEVEIFLDYQLTYVIDVNQVIELYQKWQHRYQEGFVVPMSKQIVEEVVNQYTSTEIASSKRNEVEEKIFFWLKTNFSESYLIVLEFKIDDVRLNK